MAPRRDPKLAEFQVWAGTPNELTLISGAYSVSELKTKARAELNRHRSFADKFDHPGKDHLIRVGEEINGLTAGAFAASNKLRWSFPLSRIEYTIELRRTT